MKIWLAELILSFVPSVVSILVQLGNSREFSEVALATELVIGAFMLFGNLWIAFIGSFPPSFTPTTLRDWEQIILALILLPLGTTLTAFAMMLSMATPIRPEAGFVTLCVVGGVCYVLQYHYNIW
jgi:putative Mn2+ efflux pump MntP